MKQWLIVIGVLVVVAWLASQYWRPAPDFREQTDMIAEDSLGDKPRKPALEFFESGGVFEEDATTEGLDESFYIPFLKRLEDQTGFVPEVIVDENDVAAAPFYVQLSEDQAATTRLKRFLLQEDEDFPGLVLHQYGHRWAYIDFMNEELAKETGLENWEID